MKEIMREKSQEICLVCQKTADWIRCTQFAGDHPYCDEHAKLEDDFLSIDEEASSYSYWYKIEEPT